MIPERKMRRRKKWITPVLLVLVILVGVSLLLYPTVANWINSMDYQSSINAYKQQVQALDDNTYAEILQAAHAYNEQLRRNGVYISPLSEEMRLAYENLLSVSGTGMMGYIEIPKIDLYLPIYHGTSDAVLQKYIGHIDGSSLPVGGEGVHTILSGHSGLPSADLFTDIDRLAIGDRFIIHVLNEEIVYQVDQVETVLPEQLAALRFEEGRDYCTLMTCTPYGINTHRLLVRGTRVFAEE